MRPLLCLLPLLLTLTQCVGPDGSPMSPFGPRNPQPYNEGRETYRSDMREYERGVSQQAYDRGLRDGADDSRSGLPRNLQRNPFGYAGSSSQAYRDGYEQGYRGNGLGAGGGWQQPGFGQAPTYPGGGWQAPAYPDSGSPSAPSSNDPSYNQGYEYGLRDRVSGRQADAGAHVGAYDPRYRRSFERGYYDAFEARR